MLLSKFIHELLDILAVEGDSTFALECSSHDGGLLLLEIDTATLNRESSYLHVVVTGAE